MGICVQESHWKKIWIKNERKSKQKWKQLPASRIAFQKFNCVVITLLNLNHTEFGKRKNRNNKRKPHRNTFCHIKGHTKRRFCNFSDDFLWKSFSFASSPSKYGTRGMPGPLPMWWTSQQGAGRGQKWAPETDTPSLESPEKQQSITLPADLAGLQTDSLDRHLPPCFTISLWHRKMSAFHGTKGHSRECKGLKYHLIPWHASRTPRMCSLLNHKSFFGPAAF